MFARCLIILDLRNFTFGNQLCHLITHYQMNRVMRKPKFCKYDNKGADQLRSNRATYQRLCYRYVDTKIPLLNKSESSNPPIAFCCCKAVFVSDLVGNPEDRFSHDAAHIKTGV